MSAVLRCFPKQRPFSLQQCFLILRHSNLWCMGSSVSENGNFATSHDCVYVFALVQFISYYSSRLLAFNVSGSTITRRQLLDHLAKAAESFSPLRSVSTPSRRILHFIAQLGEVEVDRSCHLRRHQTLPEDFRRRAKFGLRRVRQLLRQQLLHCVGRIKIGRPWLENQRGG